MRRVPVLLVALLLVVGTARARAADGDNRTLTLANQHLALTFDGATGALVRLASGDVLLASADADTPSFDVNLNGRWVVGDDHAPARLLRSEPAPGRLMLTRAAGVWEIAETYTLAADAPRLSRSVKLTYRGAERGKLKGVRFLTPGVAARGDGFYALPRAYPPARHPFGALEEGRISSSGVHLAPAFAQVAPARTLMWASDGRSDRVHVSVREGKESLAVTQYFEALGWVNPGGVQEVGTAALEVLDAPYEQALPALWSWMDRVGIRVPADRPEWVEDAVLYSFHPGGTIGSSFRDLGGFRAATEELLPTLPRLGINAVWIMPVEDASVYHPRDYYKFQEGLGTPEEFRALVSKAHALGMHVLQDIVPHGGRDDYPRAKEHPEWLVRDEEGKTLSYWCFDFAWPSWQRYMADVATHYVKEYGVDGYRVDACGGSKIPNWSPEIPYARASLSQLQGGLGMLRALRGAVKALKPKEGAILAETEGAPFLGVSDADYDFTLCYQVLHDLRRVPPAQFAERLQVWLEEQKYTKPRGSLRLRHVESHDSLRAQGWYGVRPMRALAALSAWIDGIPLVYHEMEIGHEPALQRIFRIRKDLPELRRGEAFYRAARCETGGVFTCLRRLGESTSLVAINLNPEPVRATFTLPTADLGLKPDAEYVLYDAWAESATPTNGRGLARFDHPLEPYGATVLAIRPPSFLASTPARPANSLPAAGVPAAGPSGTPPSVISGDGVVIARNAHYRLVLDQRSGLPRSLEGPAGQSLLGAVDLLLDTAAALPETPAAFQERGSGAAKRLEFTVALPGGGYTLAYHLGMGPSIDVEFIPQEATGSGALVLPVPDAASWAVDAAEGRLDGIFRVRHRAQRSGTHSIYWRPQGTDVVWQAATVPLRLGGSGVEARREDRSGVACALPEPLAAAPGALQLLDKLAGREGLHLLASWPEGKGSAPDGPGRRFILRVTALRPAVPAPVAPAALPAGLAVRHTGLDWVVETAHYRAVLRRTGGTLKELWALQPRARLVLSGADLYGDRGFAQESKRYGAADDVESGVRLWREGDALHLRFQGQLRGTYRFDLTRPPVEYVQEYTFTRGASFRHTWGIRSARAFRGTEGFLAAIWQVPEGASFLFRRTDRTLAEGRLVRPGPRQGETARLTPPEVPDTVRLQDADGPLALFSGIETSGPRALRNVFFHAPLFFLAWMDGQKEDLNAGAWYEASAVITAGGSKPEPVPGPTWQPQPTEKTYGLSDPSFEVNPEGGHSSLTRGEPVKLALAAGGSPWVAPPGGSITTETAQAGRSSARVVNATGDYLLWRQPIPLEMAPPGSKVRLSAWVKAEGVTLGDVGWKTGTLRLHVSGVPTPYQQAASFTGSFDWKRLTGEVTIPRGATALELQVGLNGAMGTCWIDEVRIER